MGRTDQKHNFMIVSGDKKRIQKFTDSISKHVPGATVFHGSDWAEAKYKLKNARAKVILIDEYLPKESGYEIVGRLLKDPGNDHASIVISSYVADLEKYPKEIESGRIQFLTDPDQERSLLDCIDKILAPKTSPKEELPPESQYQLKHLAPGEVLFSEGELSEMAYIVKHGRLTAYSKDSDGEKVIFGEIAAGEFVGEMSHFIHETRSATVEALTEVDLIAIPTHLLDNVIFAKPSWARALVKTLARRLKKANRALTG